MRIVDFHHAWSVPPWARRAMPTLVVIIIVVVSGASLAGHGRTALIVVAMAVLAAAAQELVRTAVRFWLRVV